MVEIIYETDAWLCIELAEVYSSAQRVRCAASALKISSRSRNSNANLENEKNETIELLNFDITTMAYLLASNQIKKKHPL